MIDSVAGATTCAMPNALNAVTVTTHHAAVSVWNVAMSVSDSERMKSPVATTALLPNMRTHRVDIGAKIISTTDCGRNTAPASTVEYPRTCCVYCVSRKMVPNSARNANVIAPLAAEKRGFSKKRTSSIGFELCSSHRKNPTSTAMPTANPASTAGDVQPSLGPSMTAHSSTARPTIERSDPKGSSLPACGSLESGTSRYPATSASTTTGTFTRNTEPHQKCCSSTPPAIGPTAMPMADTPAQTPIALARSRGSWNTLVSTDRVAGMIADAPMPMSARVPMSTVADGANADSADPTPKMTSPMVSAR